MDSMKKQNAPTLLVCSRDRYEEYKEEFRSIKYRNSPIMALGFYYGGDINRYIWSDTTYRLVWWNNKGNEKCGGCGRMLDNTDGYYLCEWEGVDKRFSFYFHKECIEPVANLYHPKHSLHILIYRDLEPSKRCHCCNRLKYCNRYCSICDFIICQDCSTKPVLLTIDHKKRHEHTLSYFPREASMTCDVCGLNYRRYFFYVCNQCDFVVHKECVYTPCIIKMSRHQHRLSFTSSLLPKEWLCGVCRQKVDENYGGYSCVKGCDYVGHSKCVLNEDVWDGKELEEEPEESDDVTPFKQIADGGFIQHFCHHHPMRFHKGVDIAIKDEKPCHACALPISKGDIFSCVECDFDLHKVCANLPMKIHHVMHPHPLFLQTNPHGIFKCSACDRMCNIFVYMCQSEHCGVRLDVNCAAISEPFKYHCHPHALFLPSKPGSTRKCSICWKRTEKYLECEECDSGFCFYCATLPMKFMYKHDKHPLVLSYKQDESGQYVRPLINSTQYWCDVCEKEICPKNGIYMCNECDTNLHIECLFGREMYLLPGRTFIWDEECYMISNNRLTRDICIHCDQRCEERIVYKRYDETICCSMSCLYMISVFYGVRKG